MNSKFSSQGRPVAQSFGARQAAAYPEPNGYSIGAAIRAITEGKTLNGYEGEVQREIERQRGGTSRSDAFYLPTAIRMSRDMTSAGVSGSNYLVGTDNLAGSFIDMLRNRTVVGEMGATFLHGMVGNVTIPKQTGAGVAYWLNTESTAITESQLTIGQLSMTPKTVGCYTEVSRLLLRQSSPAVDQIITNDLARVTALAIDSAAINGTGSAGQPTGIINTAGIGTVTGASMDYAKTLEFQSDLAASNALAGKLAYVTAPAVAALLQQRVRYASTNSPLWAGNSADGEVGGQRALTSSQMEAGSMLFGDWSQLVIGEWGMLEIAVSESHGNNFPSGIYSLRAMQTIDIGIRNAAAFSLATSIT
jgi:HK97 family phage major capsid protein